MSSPPIHTGFWIDYSQGIVLGSVITYKANYGNQLITAAALIVAITGSAFWSIVGFVIHQRICQEPSQDELDAQLRVVIKNGGTADAISTLLTMGHTWSGRAKSAWKRTILFMIPPLFIFLSFTIAGIVVSYIALDPDNSPALVKAGVCGIPSETTQVTAVQSLSNTTIVASAYVRDCYSQASTGAVTCATFNKPTLPYSYVRNASCPLGPGNCANGDSQAVNMTALLDSHDDLGINAKTSDRIQFGYTTSCAPMSYEVLQSFTNTTQEYGIRTTNKSYTYSQVSLARNYSAWSYSNVTAWPKLQVSSYSLYPYKTYWPHEDGYLTGYAKPPLNVANTDITVALINTNGMRYIAQSNDTIFATNPTPHGSITNETTLFGLKHQVSAIACSDAWKFCNGEDHCTSWLAVFSFGNHTESLNALSQSLGYNAAQNATLFRVVYGTTDSISIYSSMVNPEPLQAIDYSLGGFAVSKGLPNNQWRQEVETWYQITLAKIQYITKLYANIPPNVLNGAGFAYDPVQNPQLIRQCSQQRIQIPAGYQNFSVFGLCFVFAIGVMTLLAAWLLKKYHHKLPGRAEGQPKHEKLLSYQADSYMQLHRAAMELAGHGGWYGAHDGKTEVPYTKRAEKALTQESLTYRSRTSTGKVHHAGSELAEPKVIAGSWNGTGITIG